MTLGNPVMIDAYQAGIPANGQPVPDGAKMAKIHWKRREITFLQSTGSGNAVRTDLVAEPALATSVSPSATK